MPSSSYPLRTALAAVASGAPQTCDSAGTACTANQLLHWLYVAAGVLAVVLLLVIVLAVRVWRRNKESDLDR